jgi:hypothetical protein
MRSGRPGTAPFTLSMSIPSQTEAGETELAVVVLTEDGTIVDAHDGCKDSLGWSREKLAGQDIGALLPAHRGLLISGILQSSDSQSQLGDEPTFSMRILAQRMDQSSFPARLVVRRYGETDCWSASFYPTAPLAPPDPRPPRPSAAPEVFPSVMECTPLEETSEPCGAAGPCDPSAPSGDAEASSVFMDEAPPLSLEELEGGKESSHGEIVDDADLHGEPQNPTDAVDVPCESEPAPVEEDKKTSPEAASSEAHSDERHLLEERVASLTSQLTSLHSDLRQHLDVQARTEKKLNAFEEQLHETKKSLAQAAADLSRHQAQAASGELESARSLNKALHEHLALHKSANQALERTNAEAERQLAAINGELNQTRAALAQETAKRQELERKLTALEQEQSAQERKAKLEICRLEAALKARELELKQLELARSEKPAGQA